MANASSCSKQTNIKKHDIMSCSVLDLATGFRGHLGFITIGDGSRGGVEAESNATLPPPPQRIPWMNLSLYVQNNVT